MCFLKKGLFLDETSFYTGLILGAIGGFISGCIFLSYIYHTNIERRLIETGVVIHHSTKEGEIEYLDKNIEYIITGKK